MQDTRNVIDQYKGQPLEAIVADLDAHGSTLEIAIDNVKRDFNMGTIVRSANAFGVRHVHIIGSKQWNKRGAMMTDKYLHLHYHKTPSDFLSAIGSYPIAKKVVAVDIVPGAVPITEVDLPEETILLFGAEGPGIQPELLQHAASVVKIPQFGSTRSLNVGVAAGIAMFYWVQHHKR